MRIDGSVMDSDVHHGRSIHGNPLGPRMITERAFHLHMGWLIYVF